MKVVSSFSLFGMPCVIRACTTSSATNFNRLISDRIDSINAMSGDSPASTEAISGTSISENLTSLTKVSFVVPNGSHRSIHAGNHNILLFTVRAGSISHGADG